MRRTIAAAGVALVMALTPGVADAEGNSPPVAVDDPAVPGCHPFDHWGGSFPLVEDLRSPQAVPGWEEWFVLFGECGPLANDVDPDGDPLTLELLGEPAHGDAIWVPDAGYEMLGYRPDPDWSTAPGDLAGGSWVSDSVTYRVFDGQAWSEPADYRLWLAPINDPPTFTPGPAFAEGTAYGAPVSVPWAADIDPGPNEAEQAVAFELEVDTGGADDMFAVPPAIAADGTLSFTPGTRPGLATVLVTARDDGGLEDWGLSRAWMIPPDDTSDAVGLTILVHPAPPMPPMAADDAVVLHEDEAASLDVVVNDVDPNGDALVVTAHGEASRGTVAVGGSGELVYRPHADAHGSDSFTYTVSDGISGSDTATVSVTVLGVNDAPVARDDSMSVTEGSAPVVLPVLANDTDVDGDPLAVVSAGSPSHGAASVVAGALVYGPTAGFVGTDVIPYVATDGHGETATASVTVTVTPDAQPPVVALGQRSIAGGTIDPHTIRVRLRWAATDAGSGVGSVTLQERRDSGSWRTITPPDATGTTVRALEAGHTYAWRIRATDARGNRSAWSEWPVTAPRVRQETASTLTWTGRWRTVTASGASAGTSRWTSGAGRRVSTDFTGAAVAWVGRRQPGGGSADVWIDGSRVGTVDTGGAGTYRVILFRSSWASPGRHRLELRTVGDGPVDVDAVVVLP